MSESSPTAGKGFLRQGIEKVIDFRTRGSEAHPSLWLAAIIFVMAIFFFVFKSLPAITGLEEGAIQGSGTAGFGEFTTNQSGFLNPLRNLPLVFSR